MADHVGVWADLTASTNHHMLTHGGEGMNDGIVMANLTHVLLQFPKNWPFPAKWQVPRWVAANAGANNTAEAGEFSEWQNLAHPSMLPGSQNRTRTLTLTLTLTSDSANVLKESSTRQR